MSFNHQRLKELLNLAGSVRSPEDLRLPFDLQARILTAWRAAQLARERVELVSVFHLLRLFRLGLGLACALTLLIVSFSLHRLRHDSFYQLASPVPVINLALKP